MTPGDKVKVLYIVGWGRSGSTILANMLGEIKGFAALGEIRHTWDHSLVENRLCGCARRFLSCPVWSAVLTTAYGGHDGVNAEVMITLREGSARTQHLPVMMLPGGNRLIERRLARYLERLGALYHALRSVTRCEVIVDSSKYPSYGRILEMIPSLDLYVIHLVRDPWGVAFSWLRDKYHPDSDGAVPAPRYSAFGSSIRWLAQNLGTDLSWSRSNGRYATLRYEDVIRDPGSALRQVTQMVGARRGTFPMLRGDEIHLSQNHNIWGNPARFRTGAVRLVLDDGWKSSMRVRDKLVVTAITGPLLLRYGYTLRS